ncbi:translocation/assembly module TamB domain-containing protein [Fusobacterium sp. PH5-44]|uniref:translocation/assembly module TamB domain-containing protein n=1 Tax=unclassified Fusobacterium TaxID=2648384 RepID=UPI003D23CA9E
MKLFSKEISFENKKILKKIMTPTLVIMGIIYCFVYQLPTTIELVVYAIYGATIKSDEIIFSNGKITVKNICFSYNGQLIGKAPEVRAYYTTESLKNFRLERVEAENVEAFIERNNKDINAATAFIGSKNQNEKKFKAKFIEIEKKKNALLTDAEIEKKYKEYKIQKELKDNQEYELKKKKGKMPGGNVPINRIIIKNSSAEFRDITFSNEIKEKIYNINGEMTFNKKNGMSIEATADNRREEKHIYLFNNEKERYWMHIKSVNISPRKEWIQYGYTNNDVAVWGGVIDVDLKIGAVTKVNGKATGNGINGKYVFFDEEATEISAELEFTEKKLKGKGKGLILGHMEEVVFSYDGISKFQLESNTADIDGKYAKKYYLLTNKNIDFVNSKILNPKIYITNDSQKDPKLEIQISSDKIYYNNMELDNAKAEIVKGTSGIEIKKINGMYRLFTNNERKEMIFENKIDFGLKYGSEKGELLFNVFSGKNTYLPPIDGKIKYKNEKEKTLLEIKSNIVDLNIDYNKKNNNIVVNNKDFNIEYEAEKKMIKKGSGIINLNLGYIFTTIDFIARDNSIELKNMIIEPISDESLLQEIEDVSIKAKNRDLKNEEGTAKEELVKNQNNKKSVDLMGDYNSRNNEALEKKGTNVTMVNNKNGIITPIVAPIHSETKKGPIKVNEEKKLTEVEQKKIVQEKLEEKITNEKKEKEKKKKEEDIIFWKPLDTASKKIYIYGDMNLNEDRINLGFNAEDFLFLRRIKGKDIKIKSTFLGTIIKDGKNNPIEIDTDIDELSVDYILKLYHLYGNLKLTKGKEIFSEFFGEIGKIGYKEYETHGIKLGYGLKNQKLTIVDFKNQLFSVSGDIDLKNKKQDMKISITGMSNEQIPLNNLEFVMEDVNGELKGSFEDPIGNLKIKKTQIIFGDGKVVNFNGNVVYKNKKITMNKFKINESFADGIYNLEDNKYNARINILEETLTDYYTTSSLRHRAIGVIQIEGIGKKISIKLEGTLDKGYISRNKLPNIYAKAGYKSDNLIDGIVTVQNLSIQNNDQNSLITSSGLIDLKEKTVDMTIENNILKLSDISEYIKRNDINGNIVINGKAKGKFNEIAYNLSANGKEIAISDIKLNNISIGGKGDLNKIILENASFNYLNNSLRLSGNKELKSDKYSFNLQSSKIDLSFLNALLNKFGMNNISGTSNLDVTIENNANRGHFILDNFSISMNKYYVNLKELNSRINLNGQNLSIERFKGNLNNGTIEASGSLKNLTMDTLKDENLRENLDYDVKMKLNKIDYRYSDNFRLMCNGDLSFNKNKLKGNFQIDEGLVSKIPVESKNIYQIIANLLFRSTSKVASASRDLGSDFRVDASFDNPLELDLAFNIKNGVKLDIKDVNAFVGDVKGDVFSHGTLKGIGSELVLLGDAEVRNGSVNINESTFIINRGVVSFTKKDEYLPNINPTVYIDSKVEVDGEDLRVGINGEFKKLRFNISSRDGNSSGDLRSLLSGESEIQDETTARLVRSILNDQISQAFIRPFTRKIKNFFGLSKFRLRSSLFGTKETNSRYQTDETEFKFGVVLEAENNIYKDKLFWVASATLIDENQTNRKNSDESGALNEYDFSVQYRYKEGRSIGLGAGKVPDYKRKTDEVNSNKNSINYHIDFKFEKKYDNMLDIFKK